MTFILLSPYFYHITTIILLNSIYKGKCCGPGSAASIFGTNKDQSVSNVVSWLPTSQGLGDGAAISFLNDNLQKSFGNIRSEKYEEGTQGTITCPKDLQCSFDDENDCRWRNSNQDDLNYYLTRGRPDLDKWEIYLGTREIPKEPFLTVAGNKGDTKAWFVSDPIQEQTGDGILKFKFWTTPLLEIRVCTRNPHSSTLNFCSETVERNNGANEHAKILIPGPIEDPFEVVIETKNFITDPGGVAFIDDIEYLSATCSKENLTLKKKFSIRATTATETTITTIAQETVFDICNAIPCNFESQNCGYSLTSTKGTVSWKIENRPVGNRATGIQKDVDGNENFINSYLLAVGRGNGSSDLFVAESRPFVLSQTILISFFKHLMSAPTSLKICIMNFTYCPNTFRVNVTQRGWHSAIVELRPESLPLEFQNKPVKLLWVAENLKQNNFVGVDNIQIISSQGFLLC